MKKRILFHGEAKTDKNGQKTDTVQIHTYVCSECSFQSKIYARAIHSLFSVCVWPLHWQSRISQALVLRIFYAHAWVGNTGPNMELHEWIMQKSPTSSKLELQAWDEQKIYAWAIRSLSLIHVRPLH